MPMIGCIVLAVVCLVVHNFQVVDIMEKTANGLSFKQ